MKRLKYVAVLAVLAVASAGCIKRGDIRFTGVEDMELRGLSAAEVTVGVENASGRNLRVTDAVFELRRGGSAIGSVTLKKEVVVPRRWSGNVTVPLSISLDNPLAALSLLKALENGGAGFTVSGAATLKTGAFKKTFSIDDEPFRVFMSRFGGLSGKSKLGF